MVSLLPINICVVPDEPPEDEPPLDDPPDVPPDVPDPEPPLTVVPPGMVKVDPLVENATLPSESVR